MQNTGGLAGMILPFILMGVLFYFMLWRPQRKEQKARLAMLNGLKRGNKVVTIGGICGEITRLTERTVVLKVAEGVEITFKKEAISRVDDGNDSAN